ncbi:MAG: 30S ribosomal protein S20 [Clostridium sp.]|nr:30S ribosomal protein S20 [Clostridium sp.]MCM1444469.1 30S ribosomal protein S20 [Candidatus Amulumruptor caecigallinarius]
MPNMKNAKKKVLVDAKKKQTNNDYKASMKTAIKNVEKAVKANDKDKANENLKIAIKKIDKATGAGVTSKNYCARNKSRLTKKVNQM